MDFPYPHPHAIGKKLGVIPFTRTGAELTLAKGAEPAAPAAPYYDPAFFSQPILMQGYTPECGGYSLAFLLAYLLSQQTALSGSFSYAYEKTVDGVPTAEGTTIKAVGDAGHGAGSCLIDLFPDDGATDTSASTPYADASQQAITDALTRAGFIPVFLTDLSWNGLQAAVAKYKGVIVEAEIGKEWYTLPDGTTSWAPEVASPVRPPAEVIDSHFFVLGGKTTPTEIDFANSWGPTWGNKGFGFIAPDYAPFIKNAIVLYKVPPEVQPVVQSVQQHPTLSPQAKQTIIQAILNDIEQAVGLIGKEIA